MALRKVIECKCARCPRTWYIDDKEVEEGKPVAAAVTANFAAPDEQPIDIHFDILCPSCKSTVKNHIEGIAKVIKGKSPERKKSRAKKREEPKAPPSPARH